MLPSRAHVLGVASVVAGSLLLFTGGQVLRDGAARLAQADANAAMARGAAWLPGNWLPGNWAPENLPWPSAGSDPGPCAISQLHFGGTRAQLVKIAKDGVAHFLIIEVGPADPMMAHYRTDWLRAYAEGADTLWLGEFASLKAASARAARLCPPASRCWVGAAHCGANDMPPSAAQTFFGH
jgi:hypothetical protein